jgi:MFS family permease
MNLGFYIILAAQFFSALADNALLFAAIKLLKNLNAPEWHTPVLQQGFVVSFIVLAPFVGAFADSLPKGRVMFISNSIKFLGCAAMLAGIHPILAYSLVGFGAAAYSPAKYGILVEYLPPGKLVLANSWMEGLTVIAIILGAVVSGLLLKPHFADIMLHWLNLSPINSPAKLAIAVTAALYIIAAVFNLYIPRIPIAHKMANKNPLFLLTDFFRCFRLLWKDPLGQVSLAVTTLFWGASATLRLVVLAWAWAVFKYDIETAAMLVAWVALGVTIGSIIAARYVELEHSIKVLPVGISMGVLVILMIFVQNNFFAALLLTAIGAVGGYFVVPMNALLQHRGHRLMGAGNSIAVQNFNENLSMLAMLGLYALMGRFGLNINTILLFFGLLISGLMAVLYRIHGHDQDDGQL